MRTSSPRTRRILLLALAIAIALFAAWWLRSGDMPASANANPPLVAAVDVFDGDFAPQAGETPPSPERWRELATRLTPDNHVPEPLDAPLKPRLADLRVQARAGDADAALRLAEELRRCVDLRGRLHAFDTEHRVMPGAENNPLVQESREGTLQRIQRDMANCEGIAPDDLDERYALLRQAAEGGDFAAIHQYAMHGSPILEDSSTMFRDPEGLILFKRHVGRLVAGAARRCSAQAIRFLGEGYGYGTWFPTDLIRGEALEIVSQRLHPRDSGALSPPSSPDAERMAARIYMRYCR